jgi:two-component system response regulator RegA
MCVDYAMLGVEAGANDCCDKAVTIEQLIHRVESGRRPDPQQTRIPNLAEVQWEHIARVLNDCNGNISHAADALGEYRYTLQRKIKKLAPGALRAQQRTRRNARGTAPHDREK